MTLVAGVDCSTQNTKVVVCDAETGEVVREGRAPHPDVTEVDARVWWQAWEQASDGPPRRRRGGRRRRPAARHGARRRGRYAGPRRPAVERQPLRPAGRHPHRGARRPAGLGRRHRHRAGGELHRHQAPLGRRARARGRGAGAGRAAPPRLDHPPAAAAAPASRPPTAATPPAPATGPPPRARYRPDLLRTAFGRDLAVPRVAGPREAVGETPGGIVLAPGTGDNMAAALGLDLEPGDVVVSLGTSGTVFAVVRPAGRRRVSGIVAGFADATGRFLPLVCTLNAARVIGAALRMAGAELADLDRLALSVDDTEGLVLLPFLDGERTPALPDATGLLHGLTRANATPAPPGPRVGRGDALRARRRGRPARGLRRHPAAHRADRRGGPLGRRATDRGGPLRAARRGAGARRVRRPRAPPARRPGRCRRTTPLPAGSRRPPSCSPADGAAGYYAGVRVGVLLGARPRAAAPAGLCVRAGPPASAACGLQAPPRRAVLLDLGGLALDLGSPGRHGLLPRRLRWELTSRRTFAEMHASEDPAEGDKIMHSMLVSSGLALMAADTPNSMEFTAGNNHSVSLSGDDDAELRGYWEKLSASGTVRCRWRRRRGATASGCARRLRRALAGQHQRTSRPPDPAVRRVMTLEQSYVLRAPRDRAAGTASVVSARRLGEAHALRRAPPA